MTFVSVRVHGARDENMLITKTLCKDQCLLRLVMVTTVMRIRKGEKEVNGLDPVTGCIAGGGGGGGGTMYGGGSVLG